jgi:hypothetical protein
VTLLALVFTGVHGVAVWVDPFTHFGWRDALVPLAMWYRTHGQPRALGDRDSVIEMSSSYHSAVMGTSYAGDVGMSGLRREKGDSDMAVTTAFPRALGHTAGRATRHGHAIRGPPASTAAIRPRRAH